MKAKLGSRISYANVVATLALFVALGGSSYAAILVTGKNVKDNSLTTRDVKNRSLLKKDFKAGQLPIGRRGATGAPGAQGAKGDPGTNGTNGTNGAPATALWAVVGLDGTLARGSHVVSTSRLPGLTAVYRVTFDRDVSNCAFLAGTGGTRFEAPSGEVSATRSSDNVNSVIVVRYNSAGAQFEQPFHLAVFC